VTRDRLHKGDRLILTAPAFAAMAPGMMPTGTTGTVLRGGRFSAQVEWDTPDRDGNPTTRAGELPYVHGRIARLPEEAV
jgi:hypothetical protein